MKPRIEEREPAIGSSALCRSSRRKMKCVRLCLLKVSIFAIRACAPTAYPFVLNSKNDRLRVSESQTCATRSRWNAGAKLHGVSKQRGDRAKLRLGNGNYLDELSRNRNGRADAWQQQSESPPAPNIPKADNGNYLDVAVGAPWQQSESIPPADNVNDLGAAARAPWQQSENISPADNGNDLGVAARAPWQQSQSYPSADNGNEVGVAAGAPWQQNQSDPQAPISPRAGQSPDRAISIVSELKSNAALFAAFAFGSLNLPSTLTVSESKVTSVTTSLSISRPLPESDLIRTFVVLDICTLCLMISCVAASQLLIYRLSDGSYQDVDEYYEEPNNYDNDGTKRRKSSRESALGRLVTTYRNEFTVARLTFDLGLITLLLAVGVRSRAIFDEDIVVPIEVVIGVTAFFLSIEYFTTYIEVFRTAENLKGPLYSMTFPFLKELENVSDDAQNPSRKSSVFSRIFLPFSLVSVGVGLYVALVGGSDVSDPSRLGPYDTTPGVIKLRVVADKIDSEKSQVKGKKQIALTKKAKEKAAAEKAEAEAAKKKAQEAEAKKKADEEARKMAEEEAKIKAEEDAKRKAEEETYRRLEKQARKIAEEEAAAATAVAKAKVEAALEAAMKKAQEEATKEATATTISSTTTTP